MASLKESDPSESSRNSHWPVILRALKHRNFRLFFGGQLLSLTGTWMQNVAQAWLVYRLTDSSLLLGTVSFVGQIPVLLLAPIGGAVADRRSRHRLVVATQSSSMLLASILAALTLSGHVQIWHVAMLAGLLGTVNAFDLPARQSFLVEMVGKEDLSNAIALNSSMFNAARVVGPAVAGLLVAAVGEGWCFLLNAVSYLAVIVSLLMMRMEVRRIPEAHGSPLKELLEGMRFAWGTKPIRAILALLGLASLVGTPYSVLMPIFADRILHGGARSLGLLMGAAGAGAVIGALTVAVRTGLRGLGRMVGRASVGFGFFLVLFAYSRWFWASMLLLVPVGYCLMIQMACSNTLVQTMVPDRLRGRVMALYSMMVMGMVPIGAFFGGAVAERFGAPFAVALGGVTCLAGALFYRQALPGFRQEARQLIIAQGMGTEKPPEPPTPRPL